MKYFLILITAFSICLSPCSLYAQVKIKVAFPNLSFKNPTDLQDPKDGTDRLFVLEQRGIIYVFENDPQVKRKRVFLDIRDKVNDRGAEEGLLGLAFHPDFKNNGFFYVNYTAADPKRTVIARYSVDQANLNSADRESEFIILQFPSPLVTTMVDRPSLGRMVFYILEPAMEVGQVILLRTGKALRRCLVRF